MANGGTKRICMALKDPKYKVGQVVYVKDDDVYAKVREVVETHTGKGRVWGYHLQGECGVTHMETSNLRALTKKEMGS